jgi:hypothetical protein
MNTKTLPPSEKTGLWACFARFKPGRIITMKTQTIPLVALALLLLNPGAQAQVNTGSDGSDGALIVLANTNIDMTSRPSGIYQYSSVYITNGATVAFTPNANNTPVVWLVQGDAIISGTVNLSGANNIGAAGSAGGPGGYRGGSGISPVGQGPGGGSSMTFSNFQNVRAGYASYGTLGSTTNTCFGMSNGIPGSVYGNNYLIPLLGGSGGAGISNSCGGVGGTGGGGAILIAASGQIQLNGTINCRGGFPNSSLPCSSSTTTTYYYGGFGSGGAIRLVASIINGAGTINTSSGDNCSSSIGGQGRVRFDTYVNNFTGTVTNGVFSQGSQFVLIPASGAGAQLYIATVAGQPVSSTPSGVLITPDVFISALQTNPVPVQVQCASLPLNTPITVTVTPLSGTPVSVTVSNATGSVASSTATALIHMSRGGGYVSAMATLGN